MMELDARKKGMRGSLANPFQKAHLKLISTSCEMGKLGNIVATSSNFQKKKCVLIDFREREKHRFVVPLNYALIGRFLLVP